MPVTRYRSVEEMPKPWRKPNDPGNLRLVGQMMTFYRSLTRDAPRRAGVQRFQTWEEANAVRNDPFRC